MIYLFIDCFHFLVAVDDAAPDICIQVLVWVCIFISLESGTAGSEGKSCSIF